jgi:putative transposase
MSKRRLDTEQIIGVLKQLEALRTAVQLARETGVPNTRSRRGSRSSAGWKWLRDETQGIYRAAGLSMKRKRPKRPVRAFQPRTLPTAPNEERSLDFVHDQLANGRSVRVLAWWTRSRENAGARSGPIFASPRVTRLLAAIIAEEGRPQCLRMDNGGEVTSRHFLGWDID